MPPAITPYNFVPLAKRVLKGDEPPTFDRYHEGRHTGWIDIECKTRTPTYTRAARAIGESELSADFFHRFDENITPVLPGTSLRGMFRSVFEIMTDSRMEFFSARRLFFRSFADIGATGLRALYELAWKERHLVAGFLEDVNGTLVLRVSSLAPRGFVPIAVNDPSLPYVLRGMRAAHDQYRVEPAGLAMVHAVATTQAITLLRGAHAMSMRLWQLCPPGTVNTVKGKVMLPGPDVPPTKLKRHWYQLIVEPTAADPTYDVPEDTIIDYMEWRRMAHGARGAKFKAPRLLKDGARGKKFKAPRLLKAGEPAFAMLDDTHTVVSVIGANMMMPLRYSQSIKDVIDRQQGTPPKYDFARSVFGYVPPDSEGQAVKGRVRFEDAKCNEQNPGMLQSPLRIPNILASPKPTAIQTYLEQAELPLDNWSTTDAQIRGFKRYWHRSAKEVTDHSLKHDTGQELTPLQTRIKPVREGTTFQSRIWFENLTSAELGALYASIRLPKGLAHKFGMGKNLGLGSMHVKVVDVAVFNMKVRYDPSSQQAGRNPDTQQAIADCYSAFVNRVAPNSQSLWTSPRMRSLACMLSVKPLAHDDFTRQVSIDHDQHSVQWKERYPLARPEDYLSPDKKEGLPYAWPTDIFPVYIEEEQKANTPQPVPPVRIQKQGDQIICIVSELMGIMSGKVTLEDGRVLSNQPVGRASVNQKVMMKITQLSAGGVVRALSFVKILPID